MDDREMQLFEEGRLEELSQILEAKLKEQPEDSEVKFDLALVYQHSDRAGEAIRLYEELLRANLDDPSVLMNLGLLYHNTGKSQDAIMAFRRIIHLAQTESIERAVLSLAHINLGLVYQSMGDLDQAIKQRRRGISIDPAGCWQRLREAGDLGRGILRKRRGPGGQEVIEVWYYPEGAEDD